VKGKEEVSGEAEPFEGRSEVVEELAEDGISGCGDSGFHGTRIHPSHPVFLTSSEPHKAARVYNPFRASTPVHATA
jgi:hypothetical protein